MKPFWIVLLNVMSVIALSAHELQKHTLSHTLKPGLNEIEALTLRKGSSIVRHVKTSDYEGYVLERINEPAPLTMKDIQLVENVTKTLMTEYLNEQSKVKTITDCDYILAHYSDYLRQYINVSTDKDVIITLIFVPSHHSEADFYKQMFLISDGSGYVGWKVTVNLTKKKIENLKFF